MLFKDAMGGGISAGSAAALGGAINATVTAAGSSITDATDLTASKNVVTTATNGQGVQLYYMQAGESQIVFNNTNATIKVYPGAATMQINATTAGSGVNLAPNTFCEYYQISSTKLMADMSA
jgi:hypothetical protein